MSGSDYSLNMAIEAKDNASGVINKFLDKLGPVGGAVAVVGAAVVGIGIASTKMAGDFQTSMTGLVTGAGESQAKIKMVSDGILAMAPQVGTTTKQLAAGMFMIESAGHHGAEGLQVLKIAAQGAKVGQADLGVVTNAMTTYMQDYHISAKHAATAMNWLSAVVSNGKTHLADLAGSMSAILPIASNYGISSAEVGGAIATMTNAGMTAQNATQNLANAIRALETPNGMAVKSLKSVGLSAQQLKDTLAHKGLPEAIQLVNDAIGKKFPAGSVEADTAFKKIMGGATGMNVALMLGGKNMGAFKGAVTNITGALKSGGDSVTGWSSVQKDFNFKMDQGRATVESLMISIGTKLLPVFSSLADKIIPLISQFGDWLVKSGTLDTSIQMISNTIGKTIEIIGWFTDKIASLSYWFVNVQGPGEILRGLLIGIAAAFALMKIGSFIAMIPELVATYGFWAGAAWGVVVAEWATIAPLLVIGIVIAAAVALIVIAITHWGAIMDWISGKTEQMRIHVEEQHEKAKVASIQKTEDQKKGVLRNLEQERQGVINTLKTMADGADKEREKMKLKALDKQIATTKGDIKELDKEKAQHLAKLKQLAADDAEARKGWYDRANDATTKWFDSWKGFLSKWYDNTNEGVTKWFDSWKGILPKWYNAGNDTVTKWFDSWKGFLSRWVQDTLTHAGQMKDGFIAKLGQLKDQGIAKAQEIVQGIASFFINLPREALQWGQDMIQGLIGGIESKLGDLAGMAGKAANTIAQFLHFTKPDTGPLVNVDEWMPHMGETLIEGLNKISPKLQAAALRAAMSVSSPFSAGNTGSPGHVFDFIGSNYSGYNQGMATTKKRTASETKQLEKLEATLEKNINAYENPKPIKWDKTAKGRAHQEAAFEKAQAKREAALEKEEANIQKLENHYHITVNHTGKGKWTKQDAQELADLINQQTRLQGKHPQTASGRRN